MSDLGGRAANGGAARSGGPVPVSSSSGTPSGMRTPRQIMRDRNAREQQRQEEQKAEEQRRLAEERRRSAERRAAAVSGAGAPRYSQSSSQYTPDLSSQQVPFDQRGSGGGQVAGGDVLGNPISRSSQLYSDGRTRGPTVSQQEQPRPAPATSSGRSRTQAGQSAPRQPTSVGASAGPSAQQPQEGGQRTGASSFPHAFERWETLSSHWEGLTSYWLHKLEQNTEEIRDNVPNAVTLNRQITDLSAAGANLFHAVVELQRLRASSERKFQRWFFESKAQDEKNREVQGQLENQLKLERSGRDDAARQRAESSIQVENARREVAEMRRELMISKDEARRAWEELGRRNQDSLETAQSLKDGRITLVGGVQVVPYFGGPSRSGSASQRPITRDGPPQFGSTGMASAAGAAGLQSPGDERDYYQQEASPTNTDPFMESAPVLDPGKGSLAAGTYQPYGTPGSTSTARTAIPLSAQRPAPASAGPLGSSRAPANSQIPITAEEAQRFYQHAPQQTFLHSPQPSTQAVSAGAQQAPPAREEVRSELSYVSTLGDEGEELEPDPDYATDSGGNVRHDEQGRPIVFQRRQQSDEESYDTEADVRREQELSERYGTTSAPAMEGYTEAEGIGAGSRQEPDYEGSGYSGWEALHSTRHHHPTRLSDVLEEEEERSSRRTAE